MPEKRVNFEGSHNFVEAPTLYPDEAQFSDPIGYLSQPEIVNLAEGYGILKLVPPKGWKPPFTIDKDVFKFHTRLQNLKELNIENRPRIFFFESLTNFLSMRNKKAKVDEFFTLDNGKTADLYVLFVITDFEMNHSKGSMINWKKINGFFSLPSEDRQLKTIHDEYLRSYSRFLKKRKHSFQTMRQDDFGVEEDDGADYCMVCYKKDDPEHTLICDGCEESYHMKCLDPPVRKVPENDWFCDSCLIGKYDYGFEEDFDSLFTINEFAEHCRGFEDRYFTRHFGSTARPPLDVLEKEFWRLVDGYNLDDEDQNLEVRYGADVHSDHPNEVSGFPTATKTNIDVANPEVAKYIKHPFNLTNLPFAEGSLLNYIKDAEISGMTVPWIYVGSLFSTFCWHEEDHYTLSSNYCHFGSTKKWYGIPAKYEELFEKIITNCSPEYFKRQPDLLHQLVTLLSPAQIFERAQGEELTIVYANQNENEFIITFPKVYHAGFNTGLNFNEAVNFTMPYWVNEAGRAIQDYKEVHKENVFNYCQLSHRIMDEFLKLSGSQISDLNERYKGDYIKMINLCLRDFTREFNGLNKLNSQLTGFSTVMQQQKFDVAVANEAFRKKRGRRPKNAKEEELLCDVCKTFLSFRWVSLSNAADVKAQEAQLLTPSQSPNLAQLQIKDCEENEFQRIIREAKKLSEITGGNGSGNGNGKGSGSPGLGISTHKMDPEDHEESPQKRRRSRRLGSASSSATASPRVADGDDSRKKPAKKVAPTSVKLCLYDFFKLLDPEVYDHHKRLFRNFSNYDDFKEVFKKYGTLYYDSDESETYRFICDVNAKLNKIAYK